MGMSITRQEVFEAQHVAVLSGTNNNRATPTSLDQTDTTQDKRPHDPLTKFCFRYQQGSKFLRRNDQRLDFILGVSVDQRGSAGELSELAQEGALPVRDDVVAMSSLILLSYVDATAQDDG